MKLKLAIILLTLFAIFQFFTDGDLRGTDAPFIKASFSSSAETGSMEAHAETLPVVFEVTAYCPCELCCGEYSDGVTASGHIIEEGDTFIAAPVEIPFYTRLAIDGYAGGSYVEVKDRGGSIVGNKLDVFFSTHQEAINFGRQFLKVRFLE